MRFIRFAFFSCIILLLASFISYNRTYVPVQLFFSAYHVEMPVYFLVLSVAGIFFILGGFFMYLEVIHQKRRIRLLKKTMCRMKK